MKSFVSNTATGEIRKSKLNNLKFKIFNLKYESASNRGLKIKNFKLKIRDLFENVISSGIELAFENSLA